MVKDALSFLSFARRLGGVSVAMRKRTKRIPRLSPIWRCAHFAFRPSPGECRQMLEELWRLLGRPSLCAALGLPIYTVKSWRCAGVIPPGRADAQSGLSGACCFILSGYRASTTL